MFSTLYRYIFKELFRIFLLTAVALTVVLSLSSLLEPIQEYGIGPSQVVDLLLCFSLIMLTFVLPIAALFGASLSYGRLAADNEIDAFKASGVSPLSLTFPVFVLAMLVAMANLILSFHVMPLFVHQSEQSIKADAKQILFRNLQRHGHYRLDNRPGKQSSVYADDVNPQKDLLAGVVVVDYRGGELEKIIAVDRAHVTFDTNDQFSEVKITAQNYVQMGSDWGTFKRLSLRHRVGSLLEDKINFKRITEMKEIQADPLSFYPIKKRACDTSIQLFTELLYQDIQRQFQQGRRYVLGNDKQHIELSSTTVQMSDKHSIILTDNIDDEVDEVELYIRTQGSPPSEISLQCKTITLYLDGNEFSPHITLEFNDASNEQNTRVISWEVIRDLRLPPSIQSHVSASAILSHLTVDAINDALPMGPSEKLLNLQQLLTREINITNADIQAEIHARLVFGIGCIPMILIGAALGIIKRGGHLLSAFGISFIPAMVLLVAIVSGKQLQTNMGSNQTISGLGVMWTGLGILFLMAFYLYRRLLRH